MSITTAADVALAKLARREERRRRRDEQSAAAAAAPGVPLRRYRAAARGRPAVVADFRLSLLISGCHH